MLKKKKEKKKERKWHVDFQSFESCFRVVRASVSLRRYVCYVSVCLGIDPDPRAVVTLQLDVDDVQQ